MKINYLKLQDKKRLIMGGCVTSKDELEKITVRNKMVLSQIQTSLSSKEAVPLPKGGILMKTKIGKTGKSNNRREYPVRDSTGDNQRLDERRTQCPKLLHSADPALRNKVRAQCSGIRVPSLLQFLRSEKKSELDCGQKRRGSYQDYFPGDPARA